MNKTKQEQATAAVGNLSPKSVFTYGGVNWMVLERSSEDAGGVLCLAEKVVFNKAFDDDNCNNWEYSSLREHLNNDFLEELVDSSGAKAAFVPMVTDLTADDGLKDYGTCEDLIALISGQQLRKYGCAIPKVDSFWWTCTAYSTKANGYPHSTRFVYSTGTLGGGYAYHGNIGVRPLCKIRANTLVTIINEEEKACAASGK